MVQVAVLLYPGFTALDAVGPYEVLRWSPETELRFVAATTGPVVADTGVLALGATHTVSETPAPDVVLVPGGPGAFAAAADPAVLAWLRRVHPGTRWTVSVCTGSLVLAGAGLLHGKPAATHWAATQALAALGAVPRPTERVVRGDRVATAAGVSAGIDLALWLVEELHGRERAEVAQLNIEYDPRPPVDAGHPSRASAVVRRLALQDQIGLTRSSGQLGRSAAAVPALLWHSTIRRIRAR